MRMVFDPVADEALVELRRRFEQEVAGPFEMEYRVAESSQVKRVAIMRRC